MPSLSEYRRKRDPKITPEPFGSAKRGKKPIFVVQRHDASRLHYDFRLERAGALASWAVPKGVPLEPGAKVLAVHVEDHPLEYATFHGEIPKGQYGAGTVEIFDHGSYDLLEEKPNGQLTFDLHGSKLQGRWSLVPTHMDGKEQNWLLIKRHDGDGDDDQAAVRHAYKPMLATLESNIPHGDDWDFEVKFDGFRAVAYVRGGECKLVSRNDNDLTGRFPEVAKAIVKAVKSPNAVLDGEICRLNPEGRTSFSELQQGSGPLVYYAFDLLELDGEPRTDEPLRDRKKQLRKLLGMFMSKPAAKTPRLALQNQLRQAGIAGIELAVLHRFRRADEVEEVVQKPDPRKLAARTCGLVEELWDNLAAKRQPNVLPLRRAVGELLQIGPGFEALYWDIPSAAPHALHSFRVCQDALIIGVAAGLPEGTLQDLGVAALVHDVGYATQPPPAFDAHPLAGARLLLGQVGFHEAKVRRALAALDHHREFKDARGTPSLFGRILRIAEDYQGLLRKTGGNLPPTTALATLVPGASRRYDPVLLQLFFNRLGYYPPLSVLQLEDGRLVRTLSLVRSVETFATPRAVCLRLADGTTPKQAVLVDLAKEGKVVRVLRGS